MRPGDVEFYTIMLIGWNRLGFTRGALYTVVRRIHWSALAA